MCTYNVFRPNTTCNRQLSVSLPHFFTRTYLIYVDLIFRNLAGCWCSRVNKVIRGQARKRFKPVTSFFLASPAFFLQVWGARPVTSSEHFVHAAGETFSVHLDVLAHQGAFHHRSHDCNALSSSQGPHSSLGVGSGGEGNVTRSSISSPFS